MLNGKKWTHKNLSINCNAAAKLESPVVEEVVNIPTPKLNPINSVWLTNMSKHINHLNSEQVDDIVKLLQYFPEVTSDTPGKCNVIQHDIELLPSQLSPIRQPAYRVGPRKLEVMKAEVDYLLKNNLAEPNTWKEHVYRLTQLFHRLKEVGLTINLAKSMFGSGTVVYLGHVVGMGQLRPKQANVEAILKFPTPTTRKDLLRFLGMAGFYRRFCPNFSAVSAPLTNLTSSKVPFIWKECDVAFQQLKSMLSSGPVLRTPDHLKPFVLYIDASIKGVGAVLLQLVEEAGHTAQNHSSLIGPLESASATIFSDPLTW